MSDSVLPDGTGHSYDTWASAYYRAACNEHDAAGVGTWRDRLLAAVHDALAETDDARLADAVGLVGAVCVAWVGDIESRPARVVRLFPPPLAAPDVPTDPA